MFEYKYNHTTKHIMEWAIFLDALEWVDNWIPYTVEEYTEKNCFLFTVKRDTTLLILEDHFLTTFHKSHISQIPRLTRILHAYGSLLQMNSLAIRIEGNSESTPFEQIFFESKAAIQYLQNYDFKGPETRPSFRVGSPEQFQRTINEHRAKQFEKNKKIREARNPNANKEK